jgi:hypothetical protein
MHAAMQPCIHASMQRELTANSRSIITKKFLEGLQRNKTETQVMPVTGLNHVDDVKQSKKTTARLHKDCMESKKECMAKAEPQIPASHTISYMDPSTTEEVDMTQVKLKIVVFHDSIDNMINLNFQNIAPKTTIHLLMCYTM